MTKDEAERIDFHSGVYTRHNADYSSYGADANDIPFKRYVLGKKAVSEEEDFIMLGLAQHKTDGNSNLSWNRSNYVHLKPSGCVAEHVADLDKEVKAAKQTLEQAGARHAMALNKYTAAKEQEDGYDNE